MADEQELRLTAVLDDRASAGLARLQANLRQLGTGVQAQAMEGMRRQTGEVAAGLRQLTSGAGSAMTALTGLAGIAAAVPAALTGIVAGVASYADNLNRMGREADATGTSLAQYKANIETLRTAGITEQEAAAVIRRFTDVQEDLAQRGSRIRQQILAATPLEGRDEMQAWLSNVMVAPAEQAMAMVQQRGAQIRQGAAEQALAQAQAMGLSLDEQNAYAEREGAKAQQRFLGMFGAEALAAVRRPFREATQEEIALQNQRLEATRRWSDATGEMGSAWRDIKSTVGAIVIGPLTEEIRDIAALLRLAADGARAIERWMRGSAEGGDNLKAQINPFAAAIGSIQPMLRSIGEFFTTPLPSPVPQSVIDFFENLSIPQPVVDFFENPGEGLTHLIDRAKMAAIGLIPQSVIDFVENPSQSLVTLLTSVKDTALQLIPPSVIDFFASPEQGLYDLVNRIHDRFADLDRMAQPIRDFFENPAQGLLNLVNQIADRMQNLMPDWMRRWLGVGDAGPAAAAQGAPTPAPAPQGQPIIVPPQLQAMQAAAEAPQQPIIVPPQVQQQLQLQEPVAPAAETAPAAEAAPPQRSRWDPRSWFGGGPSQAEQPVVVERAPELIAPRGGGGGAEAMQTSLRDLLGIEDGGQAPQQVGSRLAQAAADLDQSAAQQVNVSGTGRISVDVRAPEGTRVDAEGEGLFKTTEIMRQTQMLPAEYGPAAATGVNAGAVAGTG